MASFGCRYEAAVDKLKFHPEEIPRRRALPGSRGPPAWKREGSPALENRIRGLESDIIGGLRAGTGLLLR